MTNDDEELDKLRREKLIALIEDISEGHYAAGWMGGIEDDLWRIVCGGDPNYGMGNVSSDDVATLRDLSEKIGAWPNGSDAGEDFVPLVAWRKEFAEREAIRQAARDADAAFLASEPWHVIDAPFHGHRIETIEPGPSGYPVWGESGSFLGGKADAADLQRKVDAHNAAIAHGIDVTPAV